MKLQKKDGRPRKYTNPKIRDNVIKCFLQGETEKIISKKFSISINSVSKIIVEYKKSKGIPISRRSQ